MKKLLFILPVLLLAMTSCLKNNPENEVKFARACSNRITNLNSGETSMKYCTTTYVADNIAQTIEVNLLNFSVGDETKITLSFPAMKIVNTDNGFKFEKLEEFPGIINGIENGNYMISNLRCSNEIYSADANRFAEFYNLEFNLTTPSQEYIVRNEMMNYNFINTVTSVTPVAGGEPFNWTEASYFFELNPEEKKIKATLNNIKFTSKMPALEGMILQNIDLKANGGGYVITGDDIVPKIADVDYPKYKITNIEGAISGNTGFLRFNYMGFAVSVDLKMKK